MDNIFKKLSILFERIGPEKTLSILSDKINETVNSYESDNYFKFVRSAKRVISEEYNITWSESIYRSKKTVYANAKRMLIALCIHEFPSESPSLIANVIGNGITRQKIWQVQNEIKNLNEKVSTDIEFKEKINYLHNKIKNNG